MGRVYSESRENGRGLWTLFDTGSRNSYIVQAAAGSLQRIPIHQTMQVALGGTVHRFQECCVVNLMIEGKRISTQAFVLDELGPDEYGRPIEFLFGALAMQQWGIYPVPHEHRLDLTHYTTEFVEF